MAGVISRSFWSALVVAVALSVLVDSFGVLLLNILYFDLRAREAGSVQARPVA